MTIHRRSVEPDVKARSERTESRLKVATALLAFLGALSTALGVTAGLFVKKAGTADERADTGQQQMRVLESENAALKQRISELQAASASPGTSTPAPIAPSEPSAATVLHEGDATIPSNKGIDLDALASDPQWGMLGGGTTDMAWGWGSCEGFCFFFSAEAVSVDRAASTAACASTTGYDGQSLPLSKIENGFTFCVRTESGRFALVKVTKFTNPSSPISVHIITSKKTGD